VESLPRQSESRPRQVASLRNPAKTAELAALLKEFRIQAGLSQQALAERALISVQAVSALERGYRKAPYHVTLERIADALALPQEARQALEHSARRSRGPRLAEHGAAPTHNLPRRLTSLFGRDDVVREIAGLVETAPLVSIVGTGGIGKTRVAIEVGTRLLNRFPHGVWFVELAPLNDAAAVPQAVARALHLQESPQRAPLETLFAYLAQKRLLIILDNCEHVISEARTLAGSLLRECPSVALLATSREGLNLTGEQIYRIPPLDFPKQSVPSPEEAAKYGAVALFTNRVRAADLRFEVTLENVRSVVEICRRLDGLPLALELAAARSSVLSPQEIGDRLDGVFDLLTGDRHASVPRHATMRAAIDWSYGLLSSQAQLLFDRLAAFSGGFTLETATTVCTDDNVRPQDVLESLSSLVAQSLVMANFVHGTTRYHLLEATRQYALEKLAERGERDALGHRHTQALLQVAVRLDRDWYGGSERSWFREAEAELDNFRAALRWSLEERGDLRSGRLLAGALARLWYSLAPVEGRRWVRLAIDSITEETRADELAQLYIADAELCGALFESAASLASAEHALRLRSMLDGLQIARAEHAAGSALSMIGKDSKGEALLQKVLASAERLDNRRLQALALSDLGTACSRRGDVQGARRFYAEALALYVSLGLERPAASIAGHLAEVEFEAGDTAAALERAEEARAGHAATRNRRSEAADLSNMAAYLVALDCFDDARAYALHALGAARDVATPVLSAFVLQHFAAIAVLEGTSDDPAFSRKLEQAAMLLGFVEARLKALGARRDYTERQEHERVVAALKEIFGGRLDELMALGAQWNEEAAATAALEL
jgi:predicted ATPase/transcriptional regulator with XRE-family HTH domain